MWRYFTNREISSLGRKPKHIHKEQGTGWHFNACEAWSREIVFLEFPIYRYFITVGNFVSSSHTFYNNSRLKIYMKWQTSKIQSMHTFFHFISSAQSRTTVTLWHTKVIIWTSFCIRHEIRNWRPRCQRWGSIIVHAVCRSTLTLA